MTLVILFFRLYLANSSEPDKLCNFLDPECTSENGELNVQNTKSNITIPTYVARTQEPIRLSRGKVDSRFPDEVMEEVSSYDVILRDLSCMYVKLERKFVMLL